MPRFDRDKSRRRDDDFGSRGKFLGKPISEGRRGSFEGRPVSKGRGGFKEFSMDDEPRRERLKMYSITCDKCGRESEVPFKPSGDKPVYCRDCFNKNDGGFDSRDRAPRGSSSSSAPSKDLEQINKKLDKIMKHLHIDD